jgi:hypothetical protein
VSTAGRGVPQPAPEHWQREGRPFHHRGPPLTGPQFAVTQQGGATEGLPQEPGGASVEGFGGCCAVDDRLADLRRTDVIDNLTDLWTLRGF